MTADLQRQRVSMVLRRQETPRKRDETVRRREFVRPVPSRVRRSLEAFLSQHQVTRDIGGADRGEKRGVRSRRVLY